MTALPRAHPDRDVRGRFYGRRRLTGSDAVCGFVLIVAWLSVPVQASERDPLATPIRVFGEIVGKRPESLTLELIPQHRQGSTWRAEATLLPRTPEGATFFQADFSLPASPGSDGNDPRSALFEVSALLDATPCVSPMPLTRPIDQIPRIDIIAGCPRWPTSRFLLVAISTDGARPDEITLGAVVARDALDPIDGQIAWIPESDEIQPIRAPFRLEGNGISTSQITTDSADWNDLPSFWSVRWIASDRTEGSLMERAGLSPTALDTLARVDLGRDGRLPPGSSVSWTSRFCQLGTGTLEVTPGSQVTIDLQTSLNRSDDLRRLLDEALLCSSPDGAEASASQGLRLDRAIVRPMPGGGCWIAATWFVRESMHLVDPTLVAPVGSVGAGSWIMRRLVCAGSPSGVVDY